jgi:lipopolysaccharide biosynthesis glycosyltransferase
MLICGEKKTSRRNAWILLKIIQKKVKLADQDALNYLCQGKIVRLNQDFNYEIVYNEPEQIKDQAILHYIADLKPWHKQYPNSLKEYKKYADLSPWRVNWQTNKVDFKTTPKTWGKTKLFLKHIPGLKKLVKKILGRT